jgi:hypothetical protein
MSPASAGSTHAMATRAASCSDHPRIGGEQVLTMARLRPELDQISDTSHEGVVAA